MDDFTELDGDDESADDMLAGRIGALYLRDKEIQREAEILEDPVLRQVQGVVLD